jgi:Flp pilus assembly protein TadG
MQRTHLEKRGETVTKQTPSMKRPRTFGPGQFLAGWWRKSRCRDESGAEMFEFAICAMVFFTFLFGFMELCMALFMMNSVADASRQAARWASVRGATSSVTANGVTSCANPNITTCPAQVSDIQNYAEGFPGMSSTNTTVTVNWCNDAGAACSTSEANATKGNIVKVQVSYKFASIPFISKAAINLQSTAEKVIWQ